MRKRVSAPTRKRIYISGQISGLQREIAERKFAKAEAQLRAAGLEPVNPMRNGLPYSASWEAHMGVDIANLLGCPAIYMLPCWRRSRGASLERSIALLTGKRIVYAEGDREYDRVSHAVCLATGVAPYELALPSCRRRLVYARMIYAYLRRGEGADVTDIAAELCRNHARVVRYLKRIDDERAFNREFARRLAEAVKELRTKN